MNPKIQLTLALLKPDIAVNPIATKAITDKILCNNLSIVKRKTLYWKRKDAEVFYGQHKERFFYERLLDYITCGPIIALVLAGQNSIEAWRNLMGPTKVFQANVLKPYTLRGEFGLTDTRNSTHGSDSEDSAKKEIELIFEERLSNIIANNVLKQRDDAEETDVWNESSINSTLGLRSTWSTFYQKTTSNFEWFASYRELKNNIIPGIRTALKLQPKIINQRPRILDIGCGNSLLGAYIAKELREVDVYCVDFAIESLWGFQQKTNQKPEFDDTKNCFLVSGNISEHQIFPNGNICAVIDKGTTDSILKQPGGIELAHKALINIYNILCKGGIFIQITDEPPELRIELLEEAAKRSKRNFNVSISCQQLMSDIDREYFLYTVSKL